MTQREFDELPLLLRPGQAMAALGCEREVLAVLREAHPEVATLLPGMREWRFIKAEVAKLARLAYK